MAVWLVGSVYERSTTMKSTSQFVKLVSLATLCWFLGEIDLVLSETDTGDLAILKEFRDGLENPDLLGWPDSDDPCGERWKHVFCVESRVSQIQVQGLGLKGPLPPGLNKLTSLSDLGLQKNHFSGALPSFSGLSNLQKAYLDYNEFDSIPADFFDGLVNLQFLALDNNAFNASTGWMFTKGLQDSAQLTNFSCMSCNLAGPLPDFLGSLSSLQALRLSDNNLSGEIPATFKGMSLQILWLNDQKDGGLTGPIDVVTTMTSVNSLWLHGNQFTGTIPESIGALTALKDLNLNGNRLVGLVPKSLADMPLENLDLNNNQLMGPIPEFKAAKVSYASNSFCQSAAGVPCAPEVMMLIDFLGDLSYPPRLVSSWTGNDPCSSWLGLACVSDKVSSIILPNYTLTGNLSASIGKLGSLGVIQLQNNNLIGQIPDNWTSLASLKTLDLSGNNISPPVPKFGTTVRVSIGGNPLISSGGTTASPSPSNASSGGTTASPSPSNASSGTGSIRPPSSPSSEGAGSTTHQPSGDSSEVLPVHKSSKRSIFVAIVAPLASIAILAVFLISLYICCWKRKKNTSHAPSSLVIQPRDLSDSDNRVKIVVASNTNGSHSTLTGSGSGSVNSTAMSESHVIESGNLVISVQVLRNVTKNFAPENELGRGGFGVVYKGELDDGTNIAVKRMEAGVINNKALDEFQAEIGVLSKVRHRHLVSLIGYSVEGYERMLVYEYMPQGALSRHLFHWKSFKLEPLSWKRRLNIALDVARGIEYLHNLAHQSFIHRDLKSSNILLDDDFRAKVSDFGLVKLAPNGEKSVVTRLAGTFGYLAPEYAVTGKITTKADVFSFGVVLMELLTGWMALDEDRPEESQYLAAWFWRIRSDEEKLKAAIDPTLDVNDGTFESISTIAELAGHCTAREPNQRPDMSHAVNVLSPLVDKWKPLCDEAEECGGIDYSLPLKQMVKGWQETEGKDMSYADLEDSKGSIPSRPTGFADSFTSADGR